MSKNIKSIRGMHDVLPADTSKWQYLESVLFAQMRRYSYHEIRMPVVESTALFSRSIGEVTDIVEKEMYTFEDRNGDSLTLRPEGTASCVRAGIQSGILHNQLQRLWYMGPMFRHERPQKGRYRQFHQIGVETYGMPNPEIDAELIIMTAELWKQLGLTDVRLEINSLGSNEARAQYKEMLIAYLEAYKDQLDEDSSRRLYSNPLRILDTKNPDMMSIIKGAPKLSEHLDEESRQHFEKLKKILDRADIAYNVNPNLVRGLDYYCKTVFEWVTDKLGAQGTICAGGRYDGLVAQLGGRDTPAAGFAIGLERLLSLLDDAGLIPEAVRPDIYLVTLGDVAEIEGMALACQLRTDNPDLVVLSNCSAGSLKSQLKKADNSAANIAIILGDEEIEKKIVIVKYLREKKEQITVPLNELNTFLKNYK
ncbi:MAG: histidine--tRNA ligase [Gammaproteobacteria bacterium]|nr:histidine--tRNA ligase [Gammaproteobacteria bacterium]